MTNEKGYAAYNALGHVADDLIMDALLPEDRAAAPVKMKKERPRRLLAFLESGWGVAIICALVAVSVMGGIIWAGNRPGLSIPPSGTVEPESDPVTQEILTDNSEESPTETSEPETVFVPTETTRSCTLRTNGDRYKRGGNIIYMATLTSTVPGAILDIGEESWQLLNVDTDEYVKVTWAVVNSDLVSNGDRSLLSPSSSTDLGWYCRLLQFDWETTPPGRYRLTYTGIELSDGEEYPYYDFEIYEPEDDTMPPGNQTAGKSVSFVYCSDSYAFDRAYYFAEEDDRGDAISSAVYEREMAMRDTLGVFVTAIDGGDFSEYTHEFTSRIQAGDRDVPVVMTHTYYGVSSLMTGNWLIDLQSLDEKNLIDLDADYWDKEMMARLSVADKMYLGYNDFLMPNHHMVAFNKDLYETYASAEGDLYEHVLAGNWTLDKMVAVASTVAQEESTGEKKYGFSSFAWTPMSAMMMASDIRLAEADQNGQPYVCAMDHSDRWFDLLEKVHDLATAEYSYVWWVEGASHLPGQALEADSGRVLMTLTYNRDYMRLNNRKDALGILPYPKYDVNQAEYYTMSYSGTLGVASFNMDMTAVGCVLEYLAKHAEPVTTAYDEAVLGGTAEELPQDALMLEIMRETMTHDLGFVFGDQGSAEQLMYSVPRRLIMWNEENSRNDLISQSQSYNRVLEKIFERIK